MVKFIYNKRKVVSKIRGFYFAEDLHGIGTGMCIQLLKSYYCLCFKMSETEYNDLVDKYWQDKQIDLSDFAEPQIALNAIVRNGNEINVVHPF